MRSFALAVIALLAVACSGEDNKSAYLVKKLKDPNSRATALRELGKLADKSTVPDVVYWLETPGAHQVDAALALGAIGDVTAAPKLLAQLDFAVADGASKQAMQKIRVNQAVVEALGNMKATDVAERLTGMFKSKDSRTRTLTAQALGKIGNRATTDALVQAALNDDEGPVRKAAVEALGSLGDAKAIPALVQLLYVELPGTSFYFESHYALQQIGKAAIPELMTTLERKNTTVEAIRLPSGNPIAEGAVEAKAASVLGTLRAAEAEPMMLAAMDKYYKKYLKDEWDPVAPAAVMEIAGALGELGKPTSLKPLLTIAMDKDTSLREAAGDALAMLGDASVVPQLLTTSKTGSEAGREALIRTIARLGTGEELATYDALTKAADKDVTAEMIGKALQKHRPRLVAAQACKKDIACWTGKLKDPEWTVRERAAYELAWTGAKEHQAALLEAAQDLRVEVRAAAVFGLSRLNEVDAQKLEAIHDKYRSNSDNRDVNVEIKRILARVKNAKA